MVFTPTSPEPGSCQSESSVARSNLLRARFQLRVTARRRRDRRRDGGATSAALNALPPLAKLSFCQRSYSGRFTKLDLTSSLGATRILVFYSATLVSVVSVLGPPTNPLLTSILKETAMPTNQQNFDPIPNFARQLPNRRSFLQGSATLATAFSALVGALSLPAAGAAGEANLNLLGPRPGYAPLVGTFVSLLTWMREANGVISATKNLTMTDLDHLIDPSANTIGALMLHLAATETYYQLNTFEGQKWDSWPDSVKKQWDAAMNLSGRRRPENDQGSRLRLLPEHPAENPGEDTG
jgi:hypothetical protein